MANPGQFVLQNMVMEPQVYSADVESIPIAQRMLMATFFFAVTPYPFPSSIQIWSTKPNRLDVSDAAMAQPCAKTGLWVPRHAQAVYRGRIYDKKWVPEGPYDGF